MKKTRTVVKAKVFITPLYVACFFRSSDYVQSDSKFDEVRIDTNILKVRNKEKTYRMNNQMHYNQRR
jgi:hypothetical protein